ncbi:MAG TPA: 3-deoxy-D-manno-octulosonic acid transferase [Thermoanaerobaculia bacterium]|nr:3-deoxy-D-manno-octulosonic acid transferase [Thermoanaerobaculia bacterium]
MFGLYEALLWAAFLLLLPWFAVVGFLKGKYWASFPARLGSYRGSAGEHDVWIQAVSVGEVAAAKSLVERLRGIRPGVRIVVTTTTATGQAMARRLFPSDTVTYFPFDFSFSVRRFLDHHQPRLYVAVETEIWPNAARISKARGIRVAIVNGRLSDRSFRRYRRLRPLLERVFRFYDALMVRSEADRERYVAIGAPSERISVTGNLKFDLDAMTSEAPEIAGELQRLAAGRSIFVAGSTMEGEDEALLPHLPRLITKGCFVVLAPRKPDRFEIVAALLAASGIRWARRSEIGRAPVERADVLLLDSIGELARIYQYATAAFVGGSIVRTGGHNPIEPASAGTPVAFGPNMSNFREIAETFLESGGAVEVANAAQLIAFVEKMMVDDAARAEVAEKGRQVVESNRGAATITATRLVELLG